MCLCANGDAIVVMLQMAKAVVAVALDDDVIGVLMALLLSFLLLLLMMATTAVVAAAVAADVALLWLSLMLCSSVRFPRSGKCIPGVQLEGIQIQHERHQVL